MIRRVCRTTLLGALGLIPAGVVAQSFPPPEALTALIQSRVEEDRVAGIVLGVLEADGSTSIVSYGNAGRNARPLGPKSVFEIGSVTKVVTGILFADMVARNEVSLADPVVRYLPSGVRMPARAGREITLLDLSTHHSGLPNRPSNLASVDRLNPFAGYTVEQLYDFLSAHELRRDIGSEFEYSNLSVGLLGHVLARVGGMSYEELVRERVLGPLGMTMTGITLEGDLHDWMTEGHDQGGSVVPPWDMPTLAGAGALRSNAEDMLRFLAANTGPPTTPLERAMRVSHEVREQLDPRRGIALSWRVERVGDPAIVFHTGGTAGFQAFVGFDPEKRVGVVVLVNSNPTNSIHVAGAIGRQLLNSPTVEVPAELLGSYVGEYELAPDRIITVTLENGALFAQPTGSRRVRMLPESETRFSIDGTNVQISFSRDERGRVTGMVLHQGGTDTPGRKVGEPR